MKKEAKDALNAMTFMGFMLILSFLHVLAEGLFIIITFFSTWAFLLDWFGSGDVATLISGAIATSTVFPINFIMTRFRRQTILIGYEAWLAINKNNGMYYLLDEQHTELKKEFSK